MLRFVNFRSDTFPLRGGGDWGLDPPHQLVGPDPPHQLVRPEPPREPVGLSTQVCAHVMTLNVPSTTQERGVAILSRDGVGILFFEGLKLFQDGEKDTNTAPDVTIFSSWIYSKRSCIVST